MVVSIICMILLMALVAFRFFYKPGINGVLRLVRERFSLRLSASRLERFQKIYRGKSEEELFYIHYGKTIQIMLYVAAAGLFLTAVSAFAINNAELLEGYFLERNDTTGTEKTVSLEAQTKESKKDITVVVPKREYSEKEIKQQLEKAKEYIDSVYLGENTSAKQIKKALYLPQSIPDSAVTVEWEIADTSLLSEDGTVSNQKLTQKEETQITAILSCGEKEEQLVKQLTILPVERTEEQKFWQAWKKQFQKNNKSSASEQYLKLPQKIGDTTITYVEKTASAVPLIAGAIFLVVCMVPFLRQEQLKRKLEERQEQLQLAYPDFVEQFALLVGAGLSIKGAWARMVDDIKKNGAEEKKKYLFMEMDFSLREMEHGVNEAKAYELFGKRTGILAYMKFCTLLVQNLKKGSDGFLPLLECEVENAFRERKENAKAMGEKAGTKLLLPMMLMLIIIFAIILYAAFQGM